MEVPLVEAGWGVGTLDVVPPDDHGRKYTESALSGTFPYLSLSLGGETADPGWPSPLGYEG